MGNSTSQWRILEHANLKWFQWDDEYVFHHTLSNDTHRLAELPGQLVAHLALVGGQTAVGLADRFNLDEDSTQGLLAELAKLDFVTCQS